MDHRRPPLRVIILVIVIVLVLAGYFIYNNVINRSQPADGALSASGTVETTEVAIAPELAGKVAEVLVDEGDSVKTGDTLLRLDDTLLKAQRAAAAAGLESAKAGASTAEAAVAAAQVQYDMALNTALNDDRSNRTASWNEAKPLDFNQPSWYFSKAEQMASLQTEAAAAKISLEAAQENLAFVQEKSTSSAFLGTEKRLADARVALQVAQDVLDRTNTALDAQEMKDEAQNSLDDARSELTDAQEAYDETLTTEGAQDVRQARAKLFVAQERYDLVQDQLRALQTGEQALKVVAAQAALEQAKAAAAQAQSVIRQAEANLALTEAQLAKLTVAAPADGVILTRSVELGEVVNPGSVVITIGQLAELTITVYIPEDVYGQIALDQEAEIRVDSFEGKVFKGTVIHISDKGEFTPRNVQTAEGRKATVYAIKLRVEDPENTLKPGMPADVVFK